MAEIRHANVHHLKNVNAVIPKGVLTAIIGVDSSWFNFNSKGSCDVCKGKDELAYDMAFADAVVEICEECGGKRYDPTAFSYHYQNLTIEDVLNLSIEQAFAFLTTKKSAKPCNYCWT